MKRTLSSASFLLFACCMAHAQMIPIMVNAPTVPLQRVSETATLDNFTASIKLKNVSNKTIVSYRLAMSVAVPAGCGATEFVGSDVEFTKDVVNVAAGDVTVTDQHHYPPLYFIDFEHARGSSFVYSQISVVSVQLPDGSTWTLHRSGKMFDDAKYVEQTRLNCGAQS